MPELLCNHKNCPVHRDVLIPIGSLIGSLIYPTWYCEAHRGSTQFLPKEYRNCAFCNKVVAYGVDYRHNNGQLFHTSCLIQRLNEEIRDLKNPPNLKPLRMALREYNRILNRMTYERPLLNEWYSTQQTNGQGMYKGMVGKTWGDVKDIAAKAVRKAIADLERA